jgi:predicted nucleic acid-binding protein
VVIVDTTVWIDFLGGHSTAEAAWLDRELTRERLGLTDLILYELPRPPAFPASPRS